MKNKKNWLPKLLVATLTVLLITSMFAFSVLADEGTEVTEGIENVEGKSENELLMIEKWDALDELVDKESAVGRIISDVIDKYVAKVKSVETDYGFDHPKTKDMILLYYSQGVAANEVSWIYYSNVSLLEGDDDAISIVEDEYNRIIDYIDDFDSGYLVDGKLYDKYSNDGFCADVYVTLYSEVLDNILTDDDSEAVRSIVVEAKKQLKTCKDLTKDSEDFENIVELTNGSVEVQRNKERAIENLESTFSVLCPEADIANDPIYIAAVADINSEEISQIDQLNEIVLKAITDKADDLKADKGAYESAYYENIINGCVKKVEEAGADLVVSFEDLLVSHDDNLYKAQKKDEILERLESLDNCDDEKIAELESSYNGKDGIIDNAASKESVDLEVCKAKARGDLYDNYANRLEVLSKELGEDIDVSYFTAAYESADLQIESAESVEDVNEAVKNADDKFDLEEFKIYQIEALKDAIGVICPDQKPEENDIFKEATNQINSVETDSTDDVRDISIDTLVDAVESLIPSDGKYEKEYYEQLAADLRDLADNTPAGSVISANDVLKDHAKLLHAAEAKDEILDHMNALKHCDDERIDELLDIYISEGGLVDRAEGGYEIDLEVLKAKARGDLYENYADTVASVIEKCGEDADLTALETIYTTKDKIIAYAENGEQISGVLADALNELDVEEYKIFQIHDIKDNAENVKESIEKFPFLTDEERNDYITDVNDTVDEVIDAVNGAENKSDIDEIIEDKSKKIDDIKDSAGETNDTNRGNITSSAVDKLEKDHKQTIDAIYDTKYLDEAEKNDLKDKADKTLEDAKDAMSNAKNPEEIQDIVSGGEKDFKDQQEESKKLDEDAKLTQNNTAAGEIDDKKQQTMDSLKDLEYLDDEEKEALKDKIDTAIKEAEDKVSDSQNHEDIKNAKDEALSKIEDIGEEAKKQNLYMAQLLAQQQILDKKQLFENAVEKFKYLDDEELENLRGAFDSTAEEALGKVNSAQDIVVLESVLSDALVKLEAERENALKLEDDACIAMMIPVIIVLLIIGIVEASALAVMNRKKKADGKVALASFTWFIPLAIRAVPFTAWSVTAAVAMADVIMAIYIAYYAVQISKSRVVVASANAAEDTVVVENEIAAEPELAEESAELAEEAEEPEVLVENESVEAEPIEVAEIAEETEVVEELAEEEESALEEEDDSVDGVVDELVNDKIDDGIEDAIEEVIDKAFDGYGDLEEDEEPEVVDEVEKVEDPEVIEEATETVCTSVRYNKAIVNVDSIVKCCDVNEAVDIDALKQSGLIASNVNYVKVLGRGEVDSAINVTANKFSASAMRKIAEAGGTATTVAD